MNPYFPYLLITSLFPLVVALHAAHGLSAKVRVMRWGREKDRLLGIRTSFILLAISNAFLSLAKGIQTYG